jgi:hypothetical protein
MSSPNINNIPISQEASSIINAYPLANVRGGLGIQEYINYRNDWFFFNTVWSYNYTVSTLNASGYSNSPWYFETNDDRVRFLNGQNAHVAFYSNVNIFTSPI